MPTFIPLMPEGAIIRATDPPSARPTKSRVSGTASQNVTLDFPEGVAASAIWRILLPSQNRMGVLTSDDLEVVLRYTSQDASGGNVGWQVEAAITDQGDPFDNVTAASFSAVDVSTNQAYAGAIADEQENTVTLAGLFTGIDTAKNYTLFIKITRLTVGGDLVGGISLLPSFLVVQSGVGGGTPSGVLMYTNAKRADSAIFTPSAHWKFADGAGATVADSSANANDLTLNAPYAWVAGGAPNGVDPSLRLSNGFVTNYLTTSQSRDFTLSCANYSATVINLGWTAFFRLKLSAVASNGSQFVANKQLQPATFNSGSWICAVYGNTVGANAGKFAFYGSGGGALYYTAARIDDGAWHDIVVIKDFSRAGEPLKIYLDGVLNATYASLFANADQDVHQFKMANEGTGGELPEIAEAAFLPFAIPTTVPALLWNGGGGAQRRLDDLATGLIEIAKISIFLV